MKPSTNSKNKFKRYELMVKAYNSDEGNRNLRKVVLAECVIKSIPRKVRRTSNE